MFQAHVFLSELLTNSYTVTNLGNLKLYDTPKLPKP